MNPRELELRREALRELRFLEGVRRRLGDEPGLLKAVGDLYTRAGLYADGLAVDRRLVAICPSDALVRYNLACSLARVGRACDALDALDSAFALGYADAQWMTRDEDLASLRGEPRFLELLRRMAT